jgi:pyruvate ferredoxin oxidoreductase delta subunit
MRYSKAHDDPFTMARSKLCEAEAGKTGDWRSSRPEIDRSKCIPSKTGKESCFLCWMFCPEGIVSKSIPVKINYDYCKGCGICAEECPAKAIQMVAEQSKELSADDTDERR